MIIGGHIKQLIYGISKHINYQLPKCFVSRNDHLVTIAWSTIFFINFTIQFMTIRNSVDGNTTFKNSTKTDFSGMGLCITYLHVHKNKRQFSGR